MKRIGLILVVMTALMIGFAGCNTPEDPVVNPPTGLTVTSAGANVAQNGRVNIEVEESQTFTAAATGATSYLWEVLSGTQFVTLSGENTTTLTVAARQTEGTARIRVTASNDGGAIDHVFYVDVTDSSAPTPTPPTGLGVSDGATALTAGGQVDMQIFTEGREFTASVTGGTPVITYTWAVTSGPAEIAGSPGTTVTIRPTNTATGPAVITVTASNEATTEQTAPTFSFTVNITQNPPSGLKVLQGATDVTGGKIDILETNTAGLPFTAEANRTELTFTWEILGNGGDFVEFHPAATPQTGVTQTIRPVSVGTAEIRVTAADAGGSANVVFEVEVTAGGSVNPPSKPDVTGVTEGSTIPIADVETAGRQFTATATGAIPVTGFEWTATPAGVVNLVNHNTATVTIIPLQRDSATISVVAKGADGASEAFSFTVNVVEPIVLNISTRNLWAMSNFTWIQVNGEEHEVPSVGSSVEFIAHQGTLASGTRPTLQPTITVSWTTGAPNVVAIHQTTPNRVVIEALDEGEAIITAIATVGQDVAVGTFTFSVGDEDYCYDWHPFASRIVADLMARDTWINNLHTGANAAQTQPPTGRQRNPIYASEWVTPTNDLRNHRLWALRPFYKEGLFVFSDRISDRSFLSIGTDPHFPAVPAELRGHEWIRTPATRNAGSTTINRADLADFIALVDIDVYVMADSRTLHSNPATIHATNEAERNSLNWLIGPLAEADRVGWTPTWILQPRTMFSLIGELAANSTQNPVTVDPRGGIHNAFKRSFNAGDLVELGGYRASTIAMYHVVIVPRTQAP